MFIGGMAGSTAGGFKVSRVIICFKGFIRNVRKLINPRYVAKSKLEDKPLEDETINGVFTFATLYFFILLFSTLLLSFDPINNNMITINSQSNIGVYQVEHGFTTNFTAALSSLSNIGPGLEAIGPYSSFSHYSLFSKGLITLLMLIGRLEILPVLILFSSKTWKKS